MHALTRFLPVNKPLGDPVHTNPLKILAVVAETSDLGKYGLLPLDGKVERQKLGEVFDKLADQVQYEFLEGPPTQDNIRTKLEAGGHHVLHIVGHGKFIDQQGYLFLARCGQDAAGGRRQL